VFWAIYEANRVITKFIEILDEIDTASASVIVSIIGILSTVTVFYIKARETDGSKSNGD
jgi:hypothetical protein